MNEIVSETALSPREVVDAIPDCERGDVRRARHHERLKEKHALVASRMFVVIVGVGGAVLRNIGHAEAIVGIADFIQPEVHGAVA